MGTTIHVVQTTLPGDWTEAEVGTFAQQLIEAGAACVQHHFIRSIYRWEGVVESHPEWRIQLKVGSNRLQVLLEKLNEQHPYDIPQIVYWKAGSSTSYSKWVDSS